MLLQKLDNHLLCSLIFSFYLWPLAQRLSDEAGCLFNMTFLYFKTTRDQHSCAQIWSILVIFNVSIGFVEVWSPVNNINDLVLSGFGPALQHSDLIAISEVSE